MRVEITVIGKLGEGNCTAGHKIGDKFYIGQDMKTPDGLCCSAFMNIWPNARVLLVTQDKKHEGSVSCLDPSVNLEFDLRLVD